MRLAPFHVLRYDVAVAGPPSQTSAPPYDAVDGSRYLHHRTANPYTVLQLIAGGVATATRDATVTGHDFSTARATLRRWRRTGVLTEDPQPAMYVYEERELRAGVATVQRGIVATMNLSDVDDGHLLLHEQVDPGRTRLRQARMREVPIDLTPVVAIHDGGAGPGAGQVVRATVKRQPLQAFTDEDQIGHRVWRVADPQALNAVVESYTNVTAVLADGHHRVAAARMIRSQMLQANSDPQRWNHTLVWMVDASDRGPKLTAVHRLIHGLPPVSPDGTPAIDGFELTPWPAPVSRLNRAVAARPDLTFGLITSQGSWTLHATGLASTTRQLAHMPAPLRELDVVAAIELVVPQFSQASPMDQVADVTPVIDRIESGEPASLLLLRPPTAAQVLEVAAAGLQMPPKTTWFHPKPRAGLLMRALDRPRVESPRR